MLLKLLKFFLQVLSCWFLSTFIWFYLILNYFRLFFNSLWFLIFFCKINLSILYTGLLLFFCQIIWFLVSILIWLNLFIFLFIIGTNWILLIICTCQITDIVWVLVLIRLITLSRLFLLLILITILLAVFWVCLDGSVLLSIWWIHRVIIWITFYWVRQVFTNRINRFFCMFFWFRIFSVC